MGESKSPIYLVWIFAVSCVEAVLSLINFTYLQTISPLDATVEVHNDNMKLLTSILNNEAILLINVVSVIFDPFVLSSLITSMNSRVETKLYKL